MAAPLRHENNNGLSSAPKTLPVSFSTFARASQTISQTSTGRSSSWSWKNLQRGVTRVNPGGTSTPIRPISCNPRPFPPKMARSGLSTLSADPPKRTTDLSRGYPISFVMTAIVVAAVVVFSGNVCYSSDARRFCFFCFV